MLLKENFNEEHIRELQKNSKRDPVLLERTEYAFGLLEALVWEFELFIFLISLNNFFKKINRIFF